MAMLEFTRSREPLSFFLILRRQAESNSYFGLFNGSFRLLTELATRVSVQPALREHDFVVQQFGKQSRFHLANRAVHIRQIGVGTVTKSERGMTARCIDLTANLSLFEHFAQRLHADRERRSMNVIHVKGRERFGDAFDGTLAVPCTLDSKHFSPEDGREIGEIVSRQSSGLTVERILEAWTSSATAHQLSVHKTVTQQTTKSLVYGSPRHLEMSHEI